MWPHLLGVTEGKKEGLGVLPEIRDGRLTIKSQKDGYKRLKLHAHAGVTLFSALESYVRVNTALSIQLFVEHYAVYTEANKQIKYFIILTYLCYDDREI